MSLLLGIGYLLFDAWLKFSLMVVVAAISTFLVVRTMPRVLKQGEAEQ